MRAKLQQALASHKKGQLAHAKELYEEILKVQPRNFDALHLLGVVAFQTRDPKLAVELIEEAIELNPTSAAAHSNRGNALKDLMRLDEAVASYDRAIEIKPDYAEAHNNRGNALSELKRLDEAVASYDRAIEIKPDYVEAYYNRGNALRDLERLDEAVASYDRAIEIKPDYAEAYNNRGGALHDLRRLDEALASYERAIEIKPDYAEAYNNRGLALKDLMRLDEALASYERAIEIKPDYAEAYSKRGNALSALMRLDEALASYDRAIEIKPDYADAHWNLGLCRLLLGDFAGGWQGYEWRWKTERHEGGKRDFVQPLWLGAEMLEGKTILLHSEQGLGDTLQFCRYVRLVSQLGARVIFETPKPLASLLRTLGGVAQFVAKETVLPQFDYHCPLLSLPLAFKTDLNSIPASVPYVHSDATRVAAWRDKLGEKTKLRVGVVWSGSTLQRNDHNRSMTLADMLRLLGEGVEWVSLQKEVRTGDAGLLASRADIRHFGDELKDFADTAALVELMDLVVSVDTSVAHLAGAMGKPLWVLLPFNPGWRWLLDRQDSPWYPTARLFRQSAIGDWASVIEAVREELQQMRKSKYK